MRRKNDETWIMARARVNRGWLPMPRHAEGGRHAGARSSVAQDMTKRVAYAWRALGLTGLERAHAWHADRVNALGGAR